MPEEEKQVEQEATETEKKKSSLIDLMTEHPTATFWVRFSAWVVFAAMAPLAFMMWRFNLFNKESHAFLGGWGLFVVIFAAIFLIVLIAYFRRIMMIKHVFISSCISGVCKVIIPLVALLVICYVVRNELDYLIQVLSCTILCELVAIPLNPFPEYIAELQKDVDEDKRKGTIDYLWDKYFAKKKEEE